MRERFECPANRYVFRTRLDCRRQQLELANVGPVTENARVPKMLQWTRGTDSWWHLADRRRWWPGT